MARLSVPIGRQRHSPTDGGSETMEFEYSERTKELKARVEDFMNRYIYPNEELYYEQLEEGGNRWKVVPIIERSEEHTSELQSLMRISYAVFCLKKQRE